MTDVTVVLIDRDLLFSRGLELLLERVSGGAVRVVGHTSDGCRAVEIVRRQQPDVAIVGLSLAAPGALPVIRDLKRLYPRVRVIAMGGPGAAAGGGDTDTNGAVAALRAGADGLFDTTAPPETLLAPLRATAAGMSVVPTAVMAALIEAPARRDHERLGRLTAEERTLWRLVADGLDTTDISAALLVSERTAKRRVSALLHKLRVGSRLQAAALAGRCGLLDSAE
jgi:DNA-binding NarL/FixJ family response regulator